ncbi:MAG: class I SAM-dependent methyltransferase, partial [Gammaproteobacteria bacterium]|nr:class I SAM-dependent methyltransferase [Gammaproteobacteria bacterium]
TKPGPHLPDSPVEGLIPTMNNTGWMTEKMDSYSADFAEYAGTADGEVLDIGCAYGIATLAALENGARVLACDMDPRHLEVLYARVPEQLRGRYRSKAATMPAVDFPQGSFAAILAARVLHFLNGTDIEVTVRKMKDWLIPGGRLYLVADSPYTGPWAPQAGEYERRKSEGDAWPGYVADYASFLPAHVDPAEHPDFINPLDPDILKRVCTNAGLEVIAASFLSSATKHANGRDHAGVIALKASRG